jgi:hypothetical protein
VLVTSGSSATAAAGGGIKPVLRTFNSAGGSLGAAVWEGGRLVEWGWSEEQQLVAVEASGKVRRERGVKPRVGDQGGTGVRCKVFGKPRYTITVGAVCVCVCDKRDRGRGDS